MTRFWCWLGRHDWCYTSFNARVCNHCRAAEMHTWLHTRTEEGQEVGAYVWMRVGE
jgi:hypothetical protein